MSRFQIPDNIKIDVMSKTKKNGFKVLSFLLITLGIYIYLHNLTISIIISLITFYFMSQNNKNFLKYFIILCALIFVLLSASVLPILVIFAGAILALIFIFKIPLFVAFILSILGGGITSFFLALGISQFLLPLALILTGIGVYYFQEK